MVRVAAGDVAGGERGRRATQEPARQAGQGHAQRQHRKAGESGHDRPGPASEVEPGRGPADPGTHPCPSAVPPGEELEAQQEQAEDHEDQGQQRGCRPVERGAVDSQDPGRERRVVEDLQRAVLAQQVQADQQRAAEHRGADRRQHHPEERRERSVAQRGRDVLESGVEPAQRGHGREVDERVVGQADHQHGSRVALDGVRGGDPSVAVDEGGYGERCGQHAVPQVPSGQVRSDHEPGARDADEDAQCDTADEQSHGVPDQLTDPRAEQEVRGLPRRQLGGRDDDVGQREQAGRGDQHSQHEEDRARTSRPVAGGAGQRNPACVIISTTLSPSRSEIATVGGSSSASGLTGGPRVTAGLSGYSSA